MFKGLFSHLKIRYMEMCVDCNSKRQFECNIQHSKASGQKGIQKYQSLHDLWIDHLWLRCSRLFVMFLLWCTSRCALSVVSPLFLHHCILLTSAAVLPVSSICGDTYTTNKTPDANATRLLWWDAGFLSQNSLEKSIAVKCYLSPAPTAAKKAA